MARCARAVPSRPARRIAAAVAGLVAAAMAGPAGGLAAAVCVAVAGSAWVNHRSRRADSRYEDALIEAVAAVAADLRAGRTPSAALAGGGQIAGGQVGAILHTAAAAAALGGDVGSSLTDVSAVPVTVRSGPFGEGLARMAAAWQVSARSGAALADVVDRVERDLRGERHRRQRLDAELAGPRATAWLLAGLPVVGLGLGAAMGAHPTRVLLHTVPGQVALAAGAVLDGLGVWWTVRIVDVTERAT
jgi:tight adherence protein B